MSSNGRNDGFRMLDDFVCEAMHNLDVPRASEQAQGRNESMRVIEELSFEATSKKSPEPVEERKNAS
jgi:hypothetical protein